MLLLNGDNVRSALPIKEAIKAMRTAFIYLSRGEVVSPLRTHLELKDHAGGALTMPVYIPVLNRMSVKIVTIHKENPARGLPMK